jgi:hypothetical protein
MQEHDWMTAIEDARNGLALLDGARAALSAMGDAATAEVAKYLRTGIGVDLNPEAIRATLTRPYTLVPIDEHQAWLVHWRGVEMPILGWVVRQEPAFTISRITRSIDLISPLPQWIKGELGWKPPAHKAVMDGARASIQVTEGDEDAFRRRYGSNLDRKNPDGSFRIKGGGAWIKLVAALLRDGILPYVAQPIPPDLWDADAESKIVLRDYQQDAVNEFLEKGSVFVNYPPGAGKTFIGLHILNHFTGKTLLTVDSTPAVEQWQARIAEYGNARAKSNVTVSTIQGAGKYAGMEWDLLMPDEAHRLPADKFSKLAFFKSRHRAGFSGTAWREDERQFMIAALCGFPVHIPWAKLIQAGVLKRPRIVIATVPNEDAKLGYVKRLVAGRKVGRALIFCDWIEQGQKFADALDVPFVHGQSSNKLQRILDAEVCVVSRVADESIDLPDLTLVVEVAYSGSSRRQFGQRVGRLLHGIERGEFVTVFTPDEAARFRSRIFGVEAELGGEVEIEFVNVGNVTGDEAKSARRPARRRRATAPVERTAAQDPGGKDEPADEIARALAIPGVRARIGKAEASVGGRTAPYVQRAFRFCYSAAFRSEEIAEGRGITDRRTIGRFKSACKALLGVGLFTDAGEGRYTVNQGEIGRQRVLAGAMGG